MDVFLKSVLLLLGELLTGDEPAEEASVEVCAPLASIFGRLEPSYEDICNLKFGEGMDGVDFGGRIGKAVLGSSYTSFWALVGYRMFGFRRTGGMCVMCIYKRGGASLINVK